MGSCFSTGIPNTNAVNQPPMAMVITVAGGLREYSTPVAASDVLNGDSGAASFLCSSDRLHSNEYIPPLDPKDLLHPGQIYFLLPGAKLRFPLSGEDMAALAVKACSALGLLSEKGNQRDKKIRIMPVLDVEGDLDGSSRVGSQVRLCEEKVRSGAPPAVVGHRMMRSGSVRERVTYRYSRSRLSTIPELVEW